ncbi:hypothetical protein BST61_g5482 [Cercospora zeina]
MSGETTITVEGLSEHNTSEALWLVVHGTVYELTAFAPDHPGGVDILNECAGTDASEAYDYAGHSDEAMQTLQKHRIGVLSQAAQQSSAVNKTNVSNVVLPEKDKLLAAPAETLASKGTTILTTKKLAACGAGLSSALILYVGCVWVAGIVKSSMVSSGLSGQPVTAFSLGVAVASLVGCTGLGYGYKEFTKTLDYENGVFAYPAVIPRRKAA